jgi:SulP family sulfate permease
VEASARHRAFLPAPGDVVAAISVAVVLVPQSLAYAQLAGMPAYRGLYAAALPPIAAALFASSPYLQTGPVALTSLLTFGALSALAEPGSAEYVELGALLALVVGVTRIAVGLLRAGAVAYLISHPMLLGFVPASAVLIVASQVPAFFGAVPQRGGILGGAAWVVAHPSSWARDEVLAGCIALAVLLAGRLIHPLLPWVAVTAAAGIAAVAVLDLDLATVGPIPEGLPELSLALPWDELPAVLLAGVVIALVGFVEPSSIARSYALLDRVRWDADREFVGQGSANVAAAVSGAFPVGGSFSRSAIARSTGARTRWSGAFAGALVLLLLPFASLLDDLPRTVLAAIIIASILPLVRLRPIVRLVRFSRPQFVVAAGTFVLTLALAPHVEQAVVIGFGLAVATHLVRELTIDVSSRMEGDTLHLRPRGVLWFGVAPRLEDSVRDLIAAHPDARRLVIHLDAVGRIDTTAALSLRELLRSARAAGLEAEIGDVRPRWRRLVDQVIESPRDPI